jgi:hypothetical protein
MTYLLDFFFGRTPPNLQDLGKRGGKARFRPPPPPVPAGHIDKQGVMVTAETWAGYERAVRGEDKSCLSG